MTGSRTPRQRRRGLPSLLIPMGLVAMAGVVGIMTTQDRQADAQDPAAAGDDLYTTHCAGCHQPNGEGIEGTFPPLAGNPAAADADYVAQVIAEGKSGPLEVNGVQYDASMPPIAGLSDDEVGLLVDHVAGLASGSSGDEVVDSTPEPEPDDSVPEPPGSDGGEAGRGQDLFAGADSFDEGGSACASCHAAGEIGSAGGSSLGPDLTDVAENLGGAEGLAAWLANPASETMRPIFESRPLTEQEVDDLVAFLLEAPDQDKPNSSVDWMLVGGLVGLAILIAGMALMWHNVRRPYAQKLRSSR